MINLVSLAENQEEYSFLGNSSYSKINQSNLFFSVDRRYQIPLSYVGTQVRCSTLCPSEDHFRVVM